MESLRKLVADQTTPSHSGSSQPSKQHLSIATNSSPEHSTANAGSGVSVAAAGASPANSQAPLCMTFPPLPASLHYFEAIASTRLQKLLDSLQAVHSSHSALQSQLRLPADCDIHSALQLVSDFLSRFELAVAAAGVKPTPAVQMLSGAETKAETRNPSVEPPVPQSANSEVARPSNSAVAATPNAAGAESAAAGSQP